jgi:carbon-monoxide dehydrogenase medium subunit
VAGFITLDAKENILGARLALAAVAPTPLRCQEAEELLIGKKLSPELTQKAAAACVRAARPIDDLRASAAYRRLMVQVLAQRVIKECLAQAKGTTS